MLNILKCHFTGGLTTASSGLDDIAADVQEIAQQINRNTETVDEDEDEDAENLPPRLPLPIGRLNCSTTRTVLAKLIRFHCGNQLPNYGNPASMPCWWPNHLIDWTQIKNLSHKYEGYLGNTYSNCLRIAVIRGYAHYGLDANEYVEKSISHSNVGANNLQVGKGSVPNVNGQTFLMEKKKNVHGNLEEEIIVEPALYGNNEDSMDSSLVQSDDDGVITVEGTPVTAPLTPTDSYQSVIGLHPRLPTEPLPPSVANCRSLAAAANRHMGIVNSSSDSAASPPKLPVLKPISELMPAVNSATTISNTVQINSNTCHNKYAGSSIVVSEDPKYRNFSATFLANKSSYPPKLNCQRAICQPGVAKTLKSCKIILNRLNPVTNKTCLAYSSFQNICHKSVM